MPDLRGIIVARMVRMYKGGYEEGIPVGMPIEKLPEYLIALPDDYLMAAYDSQLLGFYR